MRAFHTMTLLALAGLGAGACASSMRAIKYPGAAASFGRWESALADLEGITLTKEEAATGVWPEMHCPTSQVCNESSGGVGEVRARVYHITQPDWAAWEMDPSRYCKLAARSELVVATMLRSAIALAPDRAMAWLMDMPRPEFSFGPLADLHVEAMTRLQAILRANQAKLGRPLPPEAGGCVVSDRSLADGGSPTTRFAPTPLLHVFFRCYTPAGRGAKSLTDEVNPWGPPRGDPAIRQVAIKGDMVEYEIAYDKPQPGLVHLEIGLQGDAAIDTSTDISWLWGLPPGSVVHPSQTVAAGNSPVYFAPLLIETSDQPRLSRVSLGDSVVPSDNDFADCNDIAREVFAAAH